MFLLLYFPPQINQIFSCYVYFCSDAMRTGVWWKGGLLLLFLSVFCCYFSCFLLPLNISGEVLGLCVLFLLKSASFVSLLAWGLFRKISTVAPRWRQLEHFCVISHTIWDDSERQRGEFVLCLFVHTLKCVCVCCKLRRCLVGWYFL